MGVAALRVHAALGCWLGSIVFFSFVGAPALFREFDNERAGDAVNVVFPLYYTFGLAMALVVLAVWTVGSVVFQTSEPPLLADLGVVIAAFSNFYARYRLIPKMEAAGEDSFAEYHERSVALNLVALAGVAVAFTVLHR